MYDSRLCVPGQASWASGLGYIIVVVFQVFSDQTLGASATMSNTETRMLCKFRIIYFCTKPSYHFVMLYVSSCNKYKKTRHWLFSWFQLSFAAIWLQRLHKETLEPFGLFKKWKDLIVLRRSFLAGEGDGCVRNFRLHFLLYVFLSDGLSDFVRMFSLGTEVILLVLSCGDSNNFIKNGTHSVMYLNYCARFFT